MQNRYKYDVKQSHFDGDNEQEVIISCYVTITCETGEHFYIYILTDNINFVG